MGGINIRRWLAGGTAAGVLIWLLEGAASLLYFEDMTEALAAHGLSVEMSASTFLATVALSLLLGLILVFVYAAMRPRFGRGPWTAVIAAIALWLGGYLFSLTGYWMIGLYPVGMLATWGLVGLVELILAAVVGAWVYREGDIP